MERLHGLGRKHKHDILCRYDEGARSGFAYANGSIISLRVHEWMVQDDSFITLKEAEYSLWNDVAKHNYPTIQDDCTITWTEVTRYTCTAPLTRGIDDVDAWDELQELLTLDNDVEKEEIGSETIKLESITWQ